MQVDRRLMSIYLHSIRGFLAMAIHGDGKVPNASDNPIRRMIRDHTPHQAPRSGCGSMFPRKYLKDGLVIRLRCPLGLASVS